MGFHALFDPRMQAGVNMRVYPKRCIGRFSERGKAGKSTRSCEFTGIWIVARRSVRKPFESWAGWNRCKRRSRQGKARRKVWKQMPICLNSSAPPRTRFRCISTMESSFQIKSFVAFFTENRFPIKRKSFPFLSPSRAGLYKARQGSCRSWGFRLPW